MIKLLVVFALLFTFVSASYAHTLGASFEKRVGSYVVDIGYDPEEFEEGSTNTFVFELLEEKSRLREDFEYVWVRITRDNRTVFATGVYSQILGSTTLLYTPGEEGIYELHARYEREGDSIAEASFPFTVLKKQEDADFTLPGSITASFVIGAGATFFFSKVLSLRSTKQIRSDLK